MEVVTAMPQQQLASHVDEALRITDAANEEDVVVRVMGGVGIALRSRSPVAPPLRRAYADIDVVGRARDRNRITELLLALGYQQDAEFNRLHGATRLFFWDPVNERQLDVFLDRMQMCHTIELGERLEIDARTLSLADLLLTKLQVMETNEKDLLDLVVLLGDHPMTEGEDGINVEYLARLTAEDWGLWRTTRIVAERVEQFAAGMDGLAAKDTVRERVQTYLEVTDRSEKSRRWKLRAKVGERKRWYELPEESH